jgi:hypothetical protein
VGDDDLQPGRLGDDAGVRAEALEHRLDANARVLLVGDGGDDHVAGETGTDHRRRGEHAGGDAGLHVVAAAAVEPAVADVRDVRLAHPVHADRVDVPAEHERPPATAPACRADHRRPPDPGLHDLDLQACLGEPACDERGDLLLAGPARHQRGIDGVDRDELGDEPLDCLGCLHAPEFYRAALGNRSIPVIPFRPWQQRFRRPRRSGVRS